MSALPGRRAATALALTLAALVAAGCGSDERGPGAYEGPTDPLVESLEDPALKARLRERFTQGQADR